MKSENKLQSECIQWCWNERPNTRGLVCYNLNNSKNKIDGMMNKALGLIKGRADITFYWSGNAYFIEMKTEMGKQREEQIKWQQVVEGNGFKYYVCRSLEEFKEIIDSILKL
tara:strand:- start:28212 stop:28547 length:336 start_codon:yes stop_codon:yes gene_type:complete